MNMPPDFYLYRGDGNQAVLVTLRACRKLRALEHRGRTVILVTIEPPIASGILPQGISTSVIGLSNGRGIPLDRMVPGDVSDAQVWEVYEFGQGKLGVALEPNIGHGVIYKTKPALDSRGEVIPTPLAAKQVMSSIIRAIEASQGPAKK